MDDVTIKVRNTAERYGLVARTLHWSIGLLIVAQLVVGFWTFEFMERTAERSANIALLLDRKVKLDPVKAEFIGDEEANRLRSEALREPWRS